MDILFVLILDIIMEDLKQNQTQYALGFNSGIRLGCCIVIEKIDNEEVFNFKNIKQICSTFNKTNVMNH